MPGTCALSRDRGLGEREVGREGGGERGGGGE